MRAVVESARRVLAVALKEVRESGRQKAPFVLRTIYSAVIGLTLFGPALLAPPSEITGAQVAAVSNGLFASTVMLQSIMGFVLGLVLGMGAVRSERRNLTLGLLVLSSVRRGEIIAGKLISLVGLCSMVFLSIMPLLVIIGWGGGVDYAWLWKLAPLTVVTVALGGTMGMVMGLSARSRVVSSLWAVLVATALCLLPVWLDYVDPTLAEVVKERWLWMAPVSVASQGITGGFWWPLAIGAAFSLMFALVAVLLLYNAASSGTGRGFRRSLEALDHFYERINVGGVRLTGRGVSRPVRGSPVAWMARRSGGLGRGRYWIRLIVLNAGLSLLLLSWGVQRGDRLDGWILVIAVVALSVPLMAGASAIAGERSRKSLGVLLATPLTGEAVVRGKVRVGLELLLLALIPPLVWLGLLRALIHGPLVPHLSKLFLLLLAQSFCGFCLCLGTSLFLDSPLRAGISGALLLVGVNLAPLMSFGLLFGLDNGESLWPVLGLVVGLAALVGSGVMLMMQGDLKPAWAFLSRIVFIVCLAGVFSVFVGAADSKGWPAWPLPIPYNSAPFVSVVYLSAIGFACYGLVRERFDDAVGRAQ